MFKKTSRAAAWVAPTTELAAPPALVPDQRSEARGRVLWALRPLVIRSGTCVAGRRRRVTYANFKAGGSRFRRCCRIMPRDTIRVVAARFRHTDKV